MSGSTSQPNLNSIVAALQHAPQDTGLDLAALNEFSDYWKKSAMYTRHLTRRPSPARWRFICTKCPAADTNLKEQAASMGLANHLKRKLRSSRRSANAGDDPSKMTPGGKVVGV